MVSVIYNVLLLLGVLLYLPKWFWQAIFSKDHKPVTQLLGLSYPSLSPVKGQKVFWIHAVSLGETKAAAGLFQRIRKTYPEAFILVSSTTLTGHAEAKRNLSEADAHVFLPIDFSWVIKRWVAQFHPDVLILVESDFWYHLLSIATKKGAKALLVNGKISERSLHRFNKFFSFSQKLFSCFSILCVQSERYKERFLSLAIAEEKVLVCGNLKLDASPKRLSEGELLAWKKKCYIQDNDKIVVMGSTHSGEEDLLLEQMQCVWKLLPQIKVLLVPRHPQRFADVENMLKQKQISYGVLSKEETLLPTNQVILIDKMGILIECYQLADVSLVGGSFIPGIGGHNIFEPIQAGVPVFFGPFMHTQLDLVELVTSSHAARQLEPGQLAEALLELLPDKKKLALCKHSCDSLVQENKGSLEKTWNQLNKYFF